MNRTPSLGKPEQSWLVLLQKKKQSHQCKDEARPCTPEKTLPHMPGKWQSQGVWEETQMGLSLMVQLELSGLHQLPLNSLLVRTLVALYVQSIVLQ